MRFTAASCTWNTNPALKAREFFQAAKVKTFQDIQSIAVSGPILRNKLFFYAAANGAITPSATTYLDTVPTALMRTGNFSQSTAAVKDPLTGQPFPGNIIPASRFQPDVPGGQSVLSARAQPGRAEPSVQQLHLHVPVSAGQLRSPGLHPAVGL